MKKYLSLIALFILLTNADIVNAQESDGKTLNIVSYNILHGATLKNDFNLDLIAEVISRKSPDLVALQEVDFKTNRAKKLDLTTELGYRLKMTSLFGEAMPYDGGSYGEGVLSNYVILSSTAHPLPYSPGNEPRTALEIMIRLNSGDTVLFVGTHFDHLRDPKDRIAQVDEVNRIFLNSKYPVILAGDLNAEPQSEAISRLSKHWKMADSKLLGTYPSDSPTKKIDYIMVYPPAKWSIIEYEVLDEKVGSDHAPIYAKIRLN